MAEIILDPHAGIVDCSHQRVAIIGAGPGRTEAPWASDAWCWWALNEIPQPRFDRHFELHPAAVQSPRERAWLRACRAPCYTLDYDPELTPGSVRFPLDRIRAAGFRDYFACTFAYQITLAVLEGYKAIGLWGVELFLGTARERTVERACVEYWLGFAAGNGIEIVADSSLATTPGRHRYGYDYEAERAAVEDELDTLWDTFGQRKVD